MKTKLWLVVGAAVLALATGGWYASGRDFYTLNDGMSHDFRRAGVIFVNAETIGDMRLELREARHKVNTPKDREILQTMEAFTAFTERRYDEIAERERKAGEYGQNKQWLNASMGLIQHYGSNQIACRVELERLFPEANPWPPSEKNSVPSGGLCYKPH